MANLLTRLLRGEDITRGMTVDQYLKQLVESRLGSGYFAPTPEWGAEGRPVERIQPSFETYARDIYAAHPIIFGLMEARRSVFSEARFCWRAVTDGNPGDVLPIRDGLEILEKPWPGSQTGALLSRMRQDADLGGTAFVVREDGRGGSRLRRLRPDWVHIVMSGNPWEDLDVEFLGIAYAPNGPTNQPVRTYLPDQVCVWAPIPDPLAQFRGMSWLTPVIRELQADQAATEHRLSTLQKGAWLGPIVTAPQGTTLEQFKKFVEAADARHAGPNNAGRMVFLAPGSDIKTVAQSIKDLDLKGITGAVETRIAVASRVPAVIAQISEGLQGSSLNTGNYDAAKRQWIDGSLRPDWRSLCEALSAIVTPPDLSGLDLPEGTEAQLWILEGDIALLHKDRLEAANVRQTNATTINTLITAGFEPKSIVEAVREDDLSRLEHTGLTSVQLTPPGEGGDAPDAAGEDEYQRTLAQLRGDSEPAEATRAGDDLDERLYRSALVEVRELAEEIRRAAPIVDARGNLHSPKDGKFIPKGLGVLRGSFEAMASLLGSAERTDDNQFGLPQSALFRYQNGDCMNLASAIQTLTGGRFKLHVLTDDEGATGHVVAVSPDGRVFDVTGFRSRESLELGKPGRYSDMRPTSMSDLENLGWSVSPDLDDTRLATAILHAAGVDLDPDDVERAHELAAASDRRYRDAEYVEYIELGEQARRDYEAAVGRSAGA